MNCTCRLSLLLAVTNQYSNALTNLTRCLIGYRQTFATVYLAIYCRKPNVILNRRFRWADVSFYVAGGSYLGANYTLKGENMKKGIKMRIKVVFWGGKLSVLWLQIAYYGSASVSPYNEIPDYETDDLPPQMTI